MISLDKLKHLSKYAEVGSHGKYSYSSTESLGLDLLLLYQKSVRINISGKCVLFSKILNFEYFIRLGTLNSNISFYYN